MRPLSTLRVLGIVSAVGLAGAAGCNALTNTTAIQCTSERECTALGAGFEGTTCDLATHACVRVEQALCKTNKECIEKAGNQPAICRKSSGKCVPLITPECPVVYQRVGSSVLVQDAGPKSASALEDDNAIVIGAMTPAGVAGGLGDMHESTLQLGIEDLQKGAVNGLPGLNGGPARPFVVLSCREFFFGVDGAVRAAQHLANDVGVPLIIGPVEPANFNSFGPQVLFPKKIPSLLPYGFNSFLFSLPSPLSPKPIVWTNSYSDIGMVDVYAEFIDKILEPLLRKKGVTTTRVVLLEDANASNTGLSDLMEKKLKFNGGKSPQANGANYQRISLGNVLDIVGNPAPEAGIGKALKALTDFKPHIVLNSYPPPVIAQAFFPMVVNWPKDVEQPFQIDLTTTAPVFPPIFDVLNFVGLHGKTFSSAPHRNAARQARADAWVSRYYARFPQWRTQSAPGHPHVQEWYDLVFLAAYSIVATGSKPLTGDNLVDTLGLMNIPGTLVQTDGNGDVQKAFTTLQSGKPIDLDGVTGDMNIDPKTGRIAQPMEIWCTRKENGKIGSYAPAGFYIDDSGQAIGDLDPRCLE